MSYVKSDLTIAVKRTVTRRYVGYVLLEGKVIAKDHNSYSRKEKAMNRARLIKDMAWLNAVNVTNEEQSEEG